MESILIEKIPVHIHHFDSEQATQLRLINNQEIQSLEEQIKSLKQKKTKMKSEKLTLLNAQEKICLQKIADLQRENSDKMTEETKKLEDLKLYQIEQEEKQRKELEDLDNSQQSELRMREERFDKTLSTEHRRYCKLREDLDEMKLKFDNELSLILSGHEERMNNLADFYIEKI